MVESASELLQTAGLLTLPSDISVFNATSVGNVTMDAYNVTVSLNISMFKPNSVHLDNVTNMTAMFGDQRGSQHRLLVEHNGWSMTSEVDVISAHKRADFPLLRPSMEGGSNGLAKEAGKMRRLLLDPNDGSLLAVALGGSRTSARLGGRSLHLALLFPPSTSSRQSSNLIQ